VNLKDCKDCKDCKNLKDCKEHLRILGINLIEMMTLALLKNITSSLTFFSHTLTGFLQLTYTLVGFLHTHTLLASCLSYSFLFTTADVEDEASITNQPGYS
jgi:hypothetical protein